MPRASRRSVAFVSALVRGAEGCSDKPGRVKAAAGEHSAVLETPAVLSLIAAGVLEGSAESCRAGPAARSWLRRQIAESEPFAEQPLTVMRAAAGHVINLEESPLARLATGTASEAPFLEPHQVEAGERVRRLAERARLQPRLTMLYDAAHTAGRASAGAADISDTAADARRSLAEIHTVLPRDCAGVVMDVCGLLKGLQTVEGERGWPRRSAKLVLRIGLDQLARHYGLASEATGPASRRNRTWLGQGARPDRFE